MVKSVSLGLVISFVKVSYLILVVVFVDRNQHIVSHLLDVLVLLLVGVNKLKLLFYPLAPLAFYHFT